MGAWRSRVADAVVLGDDAVRDRMQEFRFADRLMGRCGKRMGVGNMFTAVKIPRSRNHSAS
jgi:hypothetical protein